MPRIIWADENGQLYEAYYSYSLKRISVFRVKKGFSNFLIFRKTHVSNDVINKFVGQIKRFEVKNEMQ